MCKLTPRLVTISISESGAAIRATAPPPDISGLPNRRVRNACRETQRQSERRDGHQTAVEVRLSRRRDGAQSQEGRGFLTGTVGLGRENS